MIVAAVLVAGGSGTRLGAEVPKAFVEIGGRSLLDHSRARFAVHARDVIAVVPPGFPGDVTGGATRQRSVAAGLAVLAPDVEVVLVHDAARPFVPDDVVAAVLASLADGADAVVPVVPVTDTLRHVDGGVVDRASVVAVQTPQGFRRAVLDEAHARAEGDHATDDAVLVEALGVKVHTVPGSELAFKITTPADLARAETVLRRA